MSDTIREILNDIRNNVQEMRDKTVTHEAHLKYILGNGQPGKLKEIEAILEDLKKTRWQIIGMASLIAGAVEVFHISGAKILQLLR